MAKLIGDEPRLARVYTYLINYHYLKGEPDVAMSYGERCLAIGEGAQDVPLQALARGYMGYSHHAQGHYREAESILRRNIEMLDAEQRSDAGSQTGYPLRELGGLGRLHPRRDGRVRPRPHLCRHGAALGRPDGPRL